MKEKRQDAHFLFHLSMVHVPCSIIGQFLYLCEVIINARTLLLKWTSGLHEFNSRLLLATLQLEGERISSAIELRSRYKTFPNYH